MLQSSLTARESYLYFADSNYLAARLLVLNGFYIPGISIAEQAAEQYLKLKIYELVDEDYAKKLKIGKEHSVTNLFTTVELSTKINGFTLKEIGYYQDLLDILDKGYKFRYFDTKGVLGELNKGEEVDLTFTTENLDKFDELCCELRNAVLIKGQGGCPVNKAFKDRLFYKKSSMVGEILYLKNKQYNKFKVGGRPMIEYYSSLRRPTQVPCLEDKL